MRKLYFVLIAFIIALIGCVEVPAFGLGSEVTPTPAETVDPRELPTLQPPPTATPTATAPPTPTLPPTAVPTPTPIPTIKDYVNTTAGLSFTYPSNWLISDEDPEALLIASDQQALLTNNFNHGGAVLLFPGSVSTIESLDPVDIMATFIKDFAVFDAEELAAEIEPTTVNGQSAATIGGNAVFNRFPVVIRYTVITKDQRFLIVVMMVATEDAPFLQPIAERIVSSVRLD